jgi:hypothetical protein
MSPSGRAPLSSAPANMRMRPSVASPGAATADARSGQLETDGSGAKLERPRAGTAVAEPGHRALRRAESVSAALPRKDRPLPCHSTAPGELPAARARRLGQVPAEVRGERVPALPRVRPARPRLRARRVRDLRRRALATVLLQAPRHLPLVQRPPHVEHGRAADRPCHRSRPHPATVGPDRPVRTPPCCSPQSPRRCRPSAASSSRRSSAGSASKPERSATSGSKPQPSPSASALDRASI